MSRGSKDRLPTMSSGAQTPCLTRREAAAYLRISTRTLDRLRLPRARIRVNRVVYLVSDLEAYLLASRSEEDTRMRPLKASLEQSHPRRKMARVRSQKALPFRNASWLEDALRMLRKG